MPGFLVFNEDIAFRLSFEHCARHVEEAAGLSLDGVRSYFRTEQERQVGSLEHVLAGTGSYRPFRCPSTRELSLPSFHPKRVRFHCVEPRFVFLEFFAGAFTSAIHHGHYGVSSEAMRGPTLYLVTLLSCSPSFVLRPGEAGKHASKQAS